MAGAAADVWAECVEGLNTLIDYRYQQHFKATEKACTAWVATAPAPMAKMWCSSLPAGTQILDEDGETVIADLTQVGQRIKLARGGNGGFGQCPFRPLRSTGRRAGPIPARKVRSAGSGCGSS